MENSNPVAKEVLKDIKDALTQYHRQVNEAFNRETNALNYIEITGQEHAIQVIEKYITENLDGKTYKSPEPEQKHEESNKAVDVEPVETPDVSN